MSPFLALAAALAWPAPAQAPTPAANGPWRLSDLHLVRRLVPAGDVDGDGAEDLWCAFAVVRECGFERPVGGVALLASGRASEAPRASVNALTALAVTPATAQVPGRLLRVHFEAWGETASVELRSLDGQRVLWALEHSPIALDDADGTACLLPAVDGSTAPDVVIGAAGAGAVAKLAGSDGATLWVRRTEGAGAYGRYVEPAGDLDGDGAQDVVVCVPEISPAHPDPARRAPHLEILSGADGGVLGLRALAPARVQRFRGVGDLDDDGRPDFVLQTSEPARGEGPPTWLVLSAAAEPVAVLPEHEVLWFSAWRGADGAAEVLVAVRERASDARSLQLVSPAGARRFADYPADLAPRGDPAAAGDFDGDGRTDLAVVERLRRQGLGYTHQVRLLPGASLR